MTQDRVVRQQAGESNRGPIREWRVQRQSPYRFPEWGGGQHSAPGPGVAPGSSLLAGPFSLTAQGLSPLSASPTSHIRGPGLGLA